LEGSDYDFPGNNLSVFAENIFNLTNRLSITPGLRFEHIQTRADGYYQSKVLRPDPDTGIAIDSVFWVDEYRNRARSFVIAGVGVSYKFREALEIYSNVSQNYRAINFNDIRVVNPNLVVDPEIHDEKGFNGDIGIRGGRDGVANFDVSLFYLRYEGRIGSVLHVDEENFRIYRYRTNVADSRHIGIEAFGQLDLFSLGNNNQGHKLYVFGNIALIDAVYVNAQEESIQGNDVELVPRFNGKAGITWQWKNFQMTWQNSYTADQYSDATNAEFTPSAVEGIIPAYYVMDLSARYNYKWLTVEGGANNLTNQMYFTRRATGYPGPGIIPSDGRNFYVTLQVKL
jgi:Fe(3+) dicitrate transport protein